MSSEQSPLEARLQAKADANAPAAPLSTTASLSWKINLGNYESADVFVSVSGITEHTTPEEVERLLDNGGKIAWEGIKRTIRARADEVNKNIHRSDFGGDSPY